MTAGVHPTSSSHCNVPETSFDGYVVHFHNSVSEELFECGLIIQDVVDGSHHHGSIFTLLSLDALKDFEYCGDDLPAVLQPECESLLRGVLSVVGLTLNIEEVVDEFYEILDTLIRDKSVNQIMPCMEPAGSPCNRDAIVKERHFMNETDYYIKSITNNLFIINPLRMDISRISEKTFKNNVVVFGKVTINNL